MLAAGLTREEQEHNEKRTITSAFAFHRLAPPEVQEVSQSCARDGKTMKSTSMLAKDSGEEESGEEVVETHFPLHHECTKEWRSDSWIRLSFRHSSMFTVK